MAKTISELRNQSIQVRDASATGENTATRVGTVLNDIVGHIEDYENTQSNKNTSQDTSIEAVKNSLNVEVARAKTAESNLSTLIGNERTDRQSAISREETARIQADAREKSERQAADNNEQDARIQADNAEKTARENADITLRTMIQTETSNRKTAIQQETARAKAAEEANAAAIENVANELSDHKDLNDSRFEHINDEINRLDTVDNDNAQAIADETARARGKEQELETAIADETARAKAAEEANATSIIGMERISDDLKALAYTSIQKTPILDAETSVVGAKYYEIERAIVDLELIPLTEDAEAQEVSIVKASYDSDKELIIISFYTCDESGNFITSIGAISFTETSGWVFKEANITNTSLNLGYRVRIIIDADYAMSINNVAVRNSKINSACRKPHAGLLQVLADKAVTTEKLADSAMSVAMTNAVNSIQSNIQTLQETVEKFDIVSEFSLSVPSASENRTVAKGVNYSFEKEKGYCLELNNVNTGGIKIRLFSSAVKNVGYNDCVQYFNDIEPKNGQYLIYCDKDAEWLYLQLISQTSSEVTFDGKISTSDKITELARNEYAINNSNCLQFTNESIGELSKSVSLEGEVSLNTVSIINVERGQLRASSVRQWGSINPHCDYIISGTVNIDRAENLIALFTGVANLNTFVTDFNSYLQKGEYDVNFIFNSREAKKIALSKGLKLYAVNKKTKTVIDHLTTPESGMSSKYWRGIYTMIPTGSEIIDIVFKPRAVGSNICSLWKYDDEYKTITKMEEFTIQADTLELTPIDRLKGFTVDFDMFVCFRKNGDENSAIGFTLDDTGSLMAIPASDDVFSLNDNTTPISVGNMCMRLTYKYTNLFDNSSILEVGKTKYFKSISRAALCAAYGDTIHIDSGLYLNQNIKSFGKKIHIKGSDKNGCILKCDTSDYLSPPIEMNIGSISNLTILETCENPTVSDSDKTASGFDRKNMAYCIHADNGVMSKGEKLVIDNCILKNKYRPCLGAGLNQDYSIEIKNTNCYSGEGYLNPVSGLNGCRGALYFHTVSGDENVSGQVFRAEDCTFECDDAKYATINGYYQNTMDITFIRNLFWSGKLGKSDEAFVSNVGIGEGSIITLNNKSYGNNTNLFNK